MSLVSRARCWWRNTVMFYKKLILILKTCLSVFFKTSSEGPYLNREFWSKPFDAQTEKGNFNNFGANDKSGVDWQYTPLNTNFNETSPLPFRKTVTHICGNKYRALTCRGIQDSIGFWIPRRGFRIPGARFQILCQWNLDSGLRIPIVRGISNSLSSIPDLLQQHPSWPNLPSPTSKRNYNDCKLQPQGVTVREKSRLTSLQFERVYTGFQRKKELILKFSWSRTKFSMALL